MIPAEVAREAAVLQGLGMVECAHSDEAAVCEVCLGRLLLFAVSIGLAFAVRTQVLRLQFTPMFSQGISLATHLHFEFYSEAKPDSAEASGLQVIDVPRLDQQPGNEYDIFCQLVKQYNVPEAIRYKQRLITPICLLLHTCEQRNHVSIFCTCNKYAMPTVTSLAGSLC